MVKMSNTIAAKTVNSKKDKHLRAPSKSVYSRPTQNTQEAQPATIKVVSSAHIPEAYKREGLPREDHTSYIHIYPQYTHASWGFPLLTELQ